MADIDLNKRIDFARAIKVMRNDIKPAEENNAESRGDLSAAWKIIEDDCHVNKGAAKSFRKLLEASEEKRDDWLRSFYGLMHEAQIGISQDLVDRMGDHEVPTMPIIAAIEKTFHPPATQNAKPLPLDDAELNDVIEGDDNRGGLTAADVDAMDDGSKPFDFSKAKQFAGTHGSDLSGDAPPSADPVPAKRVRAKPKPIVGARATGTSDLTALH